MNGPLELDPPVAKAFYGRFSGLREAQAAAIEPILSGSNVVLTSGTGSGKTEAVMAPLVSRHWRSGLTGNPLFLLYIVPTKALANDLEKRLAPPLATLGLRLGIRHGDRDDLIHGTAPHVLITTPESLDVMLFRKETALSSILAVVVDEVHQLYNTQRGLQLSILLSRLRALLPHRFQWAAISATVGNLLHVQKFLMGGEETAVLLPFSASRIIDAQIRHARSMADFVGLVQKVTCNAKTKLLVFANSRNECERLTAALQTEDSLRDCVFAHYSSLSSDLRIATEKKFAARDLAVCVATSTLELGIDIGDIDAVILWGVPSGVDSFLQRIGRSNRRSNKTNVICFVPDVCRTAMAEALQFAALLDSAKKGELPAQEPYELFGAVGQQLLNVIAAEEGHFTRVADLCSLLSHKPYLSREIVDAMLEQFSSEGFLQRHGYKNSYGADEKLYSLVDLKLIYGNFPISSQTIELRHETKRLGDIPRINLLRIDRGDVIRFAARSWTVKKISHEAMILEPSKSRDSKVDIAYDNCGFSTGPYVINKTWQTIHSGDFTPEIFTKDLRSGVTSFISLVRQLCSANQIPYVRTSEGIKYYTFAGYIVNKAIGLFTNKPGLKAEDFLLQVSSPIEWSAIPVQPADYQRIFPELFEPSMQQSFYQQQLPVELQKHEFLQSWLKDEEIPKILTRLATAQPVDVGQDFYSSQNTVPALPQESDVTRRLP